MKDRALVVFTFAGQQEMINRHLPFFRNGEADIIIISPCDAPVLVPNDTIGLQLGRSEYCGEGLMRRTEQGLRLVASWGYDTIAAIEGDSIVLGPVPPSEKFGLDCFLWPNNERTYKAKEYCHWPWIMGNLTARVVVDRFAEMLAADDYEGGVPDRVLGLACETMGMEMRHRPDLAYSQNRIREERFIREARTAIRNGARFVHGIKEERELEAVLA